MKNYKLIPRFVLWFLMGLGIIASILFFLPLSEAQTLMVAGDELSIPLFTDLFLTWIYILVALVCAVTLAVVIWEFVKNYRVNRRKALTGLAVVVAFVLLVLVCWCMGSADKVEILGYEGSDNVGPMAKLSDACLYLTYVLFAGTIVTLIWGVIHTKRMK